VQKFKYNPIHKKNISTQQLIVIVFVIENQTNIFSSKFFYYNLSMFLVNYKTRSEKFQQNPSKKCVLFKSRCQEQDLSIKTLLFDK